MTAKTVELHLLQSFPPSCVNRDGNNSPKDCTFGDVRRARISSQCLKRAIRQADSFAETIGEATGTRSKQMRNEILVPHLVSKGLSQEEAEKKVDEFRVLLAKNDSKKSELTSVGLYFGAPEITALLDAFVSGDKKWDKAAAPRSADVALFGRMLAEAANLNVEAAAQVAHAVSTHRLSQELDYWTAADDLKDKSDGDDAGAGMLGTAEFNASVFYRYACINLPRLASNLGERSELAKRTVEAFLRASWDAIPTGKVNGHAHYNPPLFVLAVVRQKGMPLNLVNAFLQPVRAKRDASIAVQSATALLEHLEAMQKLAPVDDAKYIAAHAFGDDLKDVKVPTVGGYGDVIKKVMELIG